MEDRNLPNVYIGVIKDVVSKVSEDFVNSEAGEELFNELQAIWEKKMLHCGIISNKPPSRRSITPFVHPVVDLNGPYQGLIKKYETPTADILFPQTPLQSEPGMYNIQTGPSDYIRSPISDCKNDLDVKIGRQSPYMQPPSHWMNKQHLAMDVNVAYDENHDHADIGDPNQPLTQDFLMMASRKRKRYDNLVNVSSGCQMPQQDGSGDVTTEFILLKVNGGFEVSS